MNQQDIKILRQSGEVATTPISDYWSDGTWLNTDIYRGQIALNIEDNKIWYRWNSGITEICSGSGSPTGITNYYPIFSASTIIEGMIFQSGTSLGFGTTTPGNKYSFHANETEDINYVSICGTDDKTRGFLIGAGGSWKWANYIYEDEDGDTQYFASGNSERDVVCLQSGGRIGVNIPTLLSNIEILRIVQTGSNTYATVTCETPHRLPNLTPVTIQGATNAKFNGDFSITNVSTMSFRINGLEVGAVSEEPTDAQVVQSTNIPAALAIFPQYFDAIYTYDSVYSGVTGSGFTNLTANLRTSFGTPDVMLYKFLLLKIS